LVNVYNKFKHKGFEIFGVSLDQNKNSWIKAIKDDGLIWTNVTDLKGWGSQAGSDYGVISIPHSVLIDKNGIIIAKDLRGDLLLKKLTELLP
jgi:peroxiredoxin